LVIHIVLYVTPQLVIAGEFYSTRHVFGCECNDNSEGNLALHLYKELVEKSKEKGFNLSKTL